jgi:hypothetical protein
MSASMASLLAIAGLLQQGLAASSELDFLPPLSCLNNEPHTFFADAWETTCQCNGGSSPLYTCPAGDTTCKIFPNVKQAYIPNFYPSGLEHKTAFRKAVAEAVGHSKVRPVFRIEGVDRPIDSNVSDDIATAAIHGACNVSACRYNSTSGKTTGLCFAGIWWDHQVEHLHTDLAAPFFAAFAAAHGRLE